MKIRNQITHRKKKCKPGLRLNILKRLKGIKQFIGQLDYLIDDLINEVDGANGQPRGGQPRGDQPRGPILGATSNYEYHATLFPLGNNIYRIIDLGNNVRGFVTYSPNNDQVEVDVTSGVFRGKYVLIADKDDDPFETGLDRVYRFDDFQGMTIILQYNALNDFATSRISFYM